MSFWSAGTFAQLSELSKESNPALIMAQGYAANQRVWQAQAQAQAWARTQAFEKAQAAQVQAYGKAFAQVRAAGSRIPQVPGILSTLLANNLCQSGNS